MSFLRKKKEAKPLSRRHDKRERFRHENGSSLLKELISSSHGVYNPFRTYSSDEILKATNNFNGSNIVAVEIFVWYRGMIEDRPVLIKKWKQESFSSDYIIRDIAISSMTSGHKNVLKLLGCCLEFRHLILVCEYTDKMTLPWIARPGRDNAILPWHIRLKIAKEIASAVTYLHTTFPRTIIHRDIKPDNIFLDETWNAKLSSFCHSISIPEGESCIYDADPVCGTAGYVEPDYIKSRLVTENFDVYSFGITMLSLLTGKSGVTWVDGNIIRLVNYVRHKVMNGRFTELIDTSMFDNGSEVSDHQMMQMSAFLELALRCIRFRPGEDVPKMIDVAKELKRVERSSLLNQIAEQA
ncbi:PREDICTED: non-functional pseudokinase ZED1-like [Tarenaya hassleriana]|uniref:non-functional pseudokinase ZED1-like n=1 Tax=Tarenaya hassleriana TaxID=28532 RepID=UPI00053C62E7|nr:PREDICTED: non-functional pseudokinase ZED1-like [Tarenaya hassleriana]